MNELTNVDWIQSNPDEYKMDGSVHDFEKAYLDQPRIKSFEPLEIHAEVTETCFLNEFSSDNCPDTQIQIKRRLVHLLAETLLTEKLIRFGKIDSGVERKYRASLVVNSNKTFNVPLQYTPPEIVYKDRLSQEQMDFIWKLLPPKITGINPTENPLRPLQLGIDPTDKTKELGSKIAKSLNQEKPRILV